MALSYDTYQGSMKTVSPAIGPYTIETYIHLDRGVTGSSGVTGANTLEPWKFTQGVTGISQANFKNIKGTNYI